MVWTTGLFLNVWAGEISVDKLVSGRQIFEAQSALLTSPWKLGRLFLPVSMPPLSVLVVLVLIQAILIKVGLKIPLLPQKKINKGGMVCCLLLLAGFTGATLQAYARTEPISKEKQVLYDFSHSDFLDYSLATYKRSESLYFLMMNDRKKALELYFEVEKLFKGSKGLKKAENLTGLSQTELYKMLTNGDHENSSL